jgi:hypothetical protein
MTLTEEQSTTASEVNETTRRRVSYSLASTLKRGDIMISGITEHSGILNPKGLDDEYVQEFSALLAEIRSMDNVQEILKGQLKERTTLIRTRAKQLRDTLGYCGVLIKRIMPKDRWVDFGIRSKQK